MAFINFVKGAREKYSQETYPNSLFFASDTHELLLQGISYGVPTTLQAVKSVEINTTGLMTISYVNGGSDTIPLTKAMVGLDKVDNTADADKPVSTAVSELVTNTKNTIDNYTVNGHKISENPTLTKTDVGLDQVDNVQQIPMSIKGQPNGVAELDENGKVPASQLNGQLAHVFGVDGVVANAEALPSEGVKEGDIYYTTEDPNFYNYNGTSWDEPMAPAEDTIYNFRNSDVTGDTGRTNILYRWDGKTLVEISESLALGETAGTAYEGNKGAANRAALDSLPGYLVSKVTKGIVTNKDITINVNEVTKYGLNYGILSPANFTLEAATSTSAGVMSAQDKSRLDTLYTQITKTGKFSFLDGTVTPSGTTLVIKNQVVDTASGEPVDTPITLPAATTTVAGVMTAADKTKLDGIAEGANAYVLPVATDAALGGIMIGYAESGKNYAVKLDGNKAYVTVNWTDQNVAQAAAINADGSYNVLVGNSANTDAETAGVNKAGGLTYNPSTHVLTTTTFVGNLQGNADTATSATKATQDGNGNVIADTYVTKQESEASLEALIARIAALEAALTIQNV